ncbi:MAG TPA: SIMPL domain-containing protein [Sphingomonas sp.]|nr:SIMPL domain-containing protein [Sphingomonas sp.]
MSERSIQVTGTGVVQTVPDVAVMAIFLRGEGVTADAATTDIAAKQKAVAGGLAGVLGPDTRITTSNVTVIEARSGACADARGYGSQPRMSTGDCAVAGYIATMQTEVRTRAVGKAATAAGLASRLGASDARVQGFVLSDPAGAQARANAAAIEDARQRAAALAKGAGLRLGAIIAVRDQASFNAAAFDASLAAATPAAPPAPQMSPVVLALTPAPIETRGQVFVTYAISP